jgi:hypothetical protein
MRAERARSAAGTQRVGGLERVPAPCNASGRTSDSIGDPTDATEAAPAQIRLERGKRKGTEMIQDAGRTIRRELDSRASDGVEITLLWNELTGQVAVSVSDPRNGEEFELVVDPDESALDVFNHPYAYAASRGLDLGGDA